MTISKNTFTGEYSYSLDAKGRINIPAKFRQSLSKNNDNTLNFNIDIVGFEITSEFVVRYGLDLNQRFRQLDSLYTLEPNMLA